MCKSVTLEREEIGIRVFKKYKKRQTTRRGRRICTVADACLATADACAAATGVTWLCASSGAARQQQATYSGTPSPLMPVFGNPLGVPTASPRGPLGCTVQAARISVRATATACPLDQHPVRAAPGGSDGHRGALHQRQAGGAGQLSRGESEALARMLYGGAPVAAGVERWTMHAKQS